MEKNIEKILKAVKGGEEKVEFKELPLGAQLLYLAKQPIESPDGSGYIANIDKAIIGTSTTSPTGAILPSQSRKHWSTTVKSNNFFNKLTHVNLKDSSKYLNVWNATARKLVSITAGTGVTPTGAMSNLANQVTLERVVYPYQLDFDDIQENAWNPAFANEVNELMFTAMMNDMHDLGVNGDGSTGTFLILNKGYIQLMKDSISTATSGKTVHRVTASNYSNWIDKFEALIDAVPDKYHDFDKLKFFVNPSDYRGLTREVGALDSNVKQLINGKLPEYGGYGFIPSVYIPSGTVWFCDPKDLAFATGLNMKYSAESKVMKNCYEYIWSVMTDFQLIRDDAIAIMY